MVLTISTNEHRAGFDHLYFETFDMIEIHRFSFPAGFHIIDTDPVTQFLLDQGAFLGSMYLLPWMIYGFMPKSWLTSSSFFDINVYTFVIGIPFLVFYIYKYSTRIPFYCPIEPTDIASFSVTKLRDFEYWRVLYDLKFLMQKYPLTDDEIFEYVLKPIMVERILEQTRTSDDDYFPAENMTLHDDLCNYINWYSEAKVNKYEDQEEAQLKEEGDLDTNGPSPELLAWAEQWDKDHPYGAYLIETFFDLYDGTVGYWTDDESLNFPTPQEYQEWLDEETGLFPPDWFWWYESVQLEGDVEIEESDFNHFHQFDDQLIFDSYNKNLYDYSISVVILSAIIILFLVLLISNIVKNKSNLIPSKTQYFQEILNKFVLNIVKEQTNGLAIMYTPLFFTVFCTILLFNMQGIVPTSFTITSQIAATGFFALTIFFALLIINILFAPFIFIKSFIPKNTPSMIKPLLFIIELLSFLLRPISMSVRLFANMMAGHILLHILIGALIFSLIYLPILVTLPIYAITAGIFILEVGIAALQSYILVVLFGIYLKETLINVIGA